jgi:hypothetical protein
MAEDADREATKERLLAMAADYDARAKAANDSEEPNSGEVANEITEPNSGEEISEVVEPMLDEAPKLTLGRKIGTKSKETVLVQRRPVGRPGRE